MVLLMDQSNSQNNPPQAGVSVQQSVQTQPAPVQPPAETTPQAVASPAPAQAASEQTPPAVPTPSVEQSTPEAPQNNYVHTVGESLIDLLTDISTSDARKQKLAEVMKISVEDVTGILDELLDKIDGELITEAELALIMTSPVTEEANGQKQSA